MEIGNWAKVVKDFECEETGQSTWVGKIGTIVKFVKDGGPIVVIQFPEDQIPEYDPETDLDRVGWFTPDELEVLKPDLSYVDPETGEVIAHCTKDGELLYNSGTRDQVLAKLRMLNLIQQPPCEGCGGAIWNMQRSAH